MKWSLSLMCVFLTGGAKGGEIFVHANDWSEKKFQGFLAAKPADTRLTQFWLRKTRIQNLDSILISNDAELLRKGIKKLEQGPWLATEVEFLLGLLERIPFQELTIDEKETALAILVSNEDLQADHLAFFRQLKSQRQNEISYYEPNELDELSKLGQPNDLLFIDGKIWIQGERISKLDHQWLMISDSFFPVLSLGSLDTFRKAFSLRLAFASYCQRPLSIWKGISSLQVTNLGSSESCLPELDMSFQQSTLAEKTTSHRTWWVASAAAISGVLIASGFHHGNFSIHWPHFKF